MLDIKFIKENKEMIKENIKNRFVEADVDRVLELYEKKNKIQIELDSLRNRRNENANKMKQKLIEEEKAKLIEEGKLLKLKINELEDELNKTIELYTIELLKIPNLTHPQTPIGKENDSKVIKTVGEIKNFSFKPKDHIELGYILDLFDFESAAKVSGQKFYYLKNEAVFLELGLINFAMNFLKSKGYTAYITPDLARENVLNGIGFNPRGQETNIYSIKDSDLCLIATAEITLGGMYMNEIIPEEKLPIKMVGLSHCFRTEAGAAGKTQKGLYRVHQFSKVEMFLVTKEDDSEKMHEELREIEEEIYTNLNIPFRVLDIASGDLGSPAYRKYDLEAWLPGRNEFGEITSTSNCTDYQSRRLNIRYKDKKGNIKFVHMLNGTAIAIPRTIIAILENFQMEDGSIIIPEVLRKYTGFEIIKPKRENNNAKKE